MSNIVSVIVIMIGLYLEVPVSEPVWKAVCCELVSVAQIDDV